MTTIEEFKAELAQLLEAHWACVKNAPVRRGYNRTFSTQIPSKNDMTRALQANIRILDDMCYQTTGHNIWDFDEEEVKLKGKPK